MTVTFHCPNCDSSFNVAERHLGRVGRCKKCGAEFPLVPGTRDGGSLPATDADADPGPSTVEHREGAAPARIGRFQVVRRLGTGGMGTVYLAHDTQLDRPVALKVPHPDQARQPSSRQRFLREARAAARFDHPNFCKIHDIGEADGLLFLAMDYVDGQSLDRSIHQGRPWDPREAAEVVRQLAIALAEAHRTGIVHRDLKPANVMIDARGRLVVMDFGLVRVIDDEDPHLTVTGAIMGTPGYMSPEQAQGDSRAVGPRSDVYSLGVILYEMLAGRRPFAGTPPSVLAQILTTDPNPPSFHHRAIDPALESICLKAMARNPEDRYDSMGAFAEALRAWLEAPVRANASPSPPRPEPARRSRRKPVVLILSGTVVLGLLVAAGFIAKDFADRQGKVIAVVEPAPPVKAPEAKTGTRSAPAADPPAFVNSIGIKLKRIPAGEFWMGSGTSDPEARDDEKVIGKKHLVRITRPFYLGTTEVTVGEFRRFVEASGYRTEAERDGKGGMGLDNPQAKFRRDPKYNWRSTGFAQADDHPVVNVTSNDALAFCEWLSRQEGRTYRLPTEAEWEYACRAGTSTKFYPGDDPEGLVKFANVGDATVKEKHHELAAIKTIKAKDGYVFTSPVGRFGANAFGLFDMHGNVFEWCSDWYDAIYYSRSPKADPPGSSQPGDRVHRGGSWHTVPRYCRSASRGRDAPDHRSYNLGFRVARDLSGP